MLLNIIKNAVEATLEADGEQVTVRWRTKSGEVHVLVEDEGPGLGDTGNMFVPLGWAADVQVGGWRDGVLLQLTLAGGDNWKIRDAQDTPAKFMPHKPWRRTSAPCRETLACLASSLWYGSAWVTPI